MSQSVEKERFTRTVQLSLVQTHNDQVRPYMPKRRHWHPDWGFTVTWLIGTGLTAWWAWYLWPK